MHPGPVLKTITVGVKDKNVLSRVALVSVPIEKAISRRPVSFAVGPADMADAVISEGKERVFAKAFGRKGLLELNAP